MGMRVCGWIYIGTCAWTYTPPPLSLDFSFRAYFFRNILNLCASSADADPLPPPKKSPYAEHETLRRLVRRLTLQRTHQFEPTLDKNLLHAALETLRRFKCGVRLGMYTRICAKT